MSEEFWFVEPISVVRGTDYGELIAHDWPSGAITLVMGPSCMERIQHMACLADQAGYEVTLVEYQRDPMLGNCYELYARKLTRQGEDK